MELNVNKEIRDYHEQIYFGLSMRQCIFAILAVGTSVLLYFLLSDKLSMELTSWCCVLGAAPFVVLGFVKYHGMTAEQFLQVWFKYQKMQRVRITAETQNLYADLFLQDNDTKKKKRKGGRK